MHYHRRPAWALSEAAATDERLFMNRRKVLAGLGLGVVAGAGLMPNALRAEAGETLIQPKPPLNPAFADAGRLITDQDITSTYNNFYEFGSSKRISREAQKLRVDPWTVTFDGMVENPMELGFDDIMAKVQLEERVVRHRCVEAWSMVVPWTGFKMSELVKIAKPF